MPKDHFIMDHGSGYTSELWRVEIIRQHWRKFVWRDVPPGAHWSGVSIQFDDIDGHPVDCFGLPLLGKFVDVFAKEC